MEKNNGFFKMPEYFFDYGLQVFTHTEYDIIAYILRNIIGWNDGRLECILSIKNIALMRHHSEKNIIKTINNLIKKTNVFSKVVYREKGSCIKKTKYIITNDSIKILNDYIKKNIPTDFETKKENLKNRTILAIEKIEKEKQSLIEKQKVILDSIKENERKKLEPKPTMNDYDFTELINAWHEILDDYYPDECRYDTFKEYKEYIYDAYFWSIPEEKYDDKIDIKLSVLISFTEDFKTIDFLNTLIKNKKMVGGQSQYLYDTLKIGFRFKGRNFERINVIYE